VIFQPKSLEHQRARLQPAVAGYHQKTVARFAAWRPALSEETASGLQSQKQGAGMLPK
jgi:hypothetical protein